jgi:small-conductance mechanosensitive channel
MRSDAARGVGQVIATSLWHGGVGDVPVYGWRITGAVLVLALTLVGGRLAHSHVRRTLAKTSIGLNPTVLIARAARAGVYFLGGLWALGIFSVSFTAIAAVVSVAALAVSLSLQDLLKSLIAGIYLLAERPFVIGDRITVAGVTGVIDDIQMRATYLHSDQGERIVLPNQSVFTQVIVNNSVAGGRTISVGLELPRATDKASIQTGVETALDAMPGPVTAPNFTPKLFPVGATAERTQWRLTVWLPEGIDPGDLALALIQQLSEATIDAGTIAL